MGPQHKRRFWRICRIYFRRFRIAVWFVVLVLLSAVVYLNQVGLPGLLKGPLLNKLKQQGLDLQFSRLRVSWSQGIVAENVHFGPATEESSPRLKVAEVQVRLNWEAAAHLQLQVDSLMLRQGRVTWAFGSSNLPPQELEVANIQTDLRFLPGDQWSLDNFKAQFAGANIQLSGVVSNASAIGDWQVFHGQQPASRSTRLWENRLRSLADTLEQIHFSAPPELRVNVRGDALNLHTFNVLLSLSAPGAETPWGAISQGRFAARLFSVDTNGISRAELDLHAQEAQTPWAAITNFALNMRLTSAEQQTNLVNGEIKLSAGQASSQWAQGSNAQFTATWVHSITNPIPISGRGSITCGFLQTAWGSATGLQLGADLQTPSAGNLPLPDPSWAWWTNLQPYQLSWDCRLAHLSSSQVEVDGISCAGDWLAPRLNVTNLQGTAFDGHLDAQADLDVATRATRLKFTSDLDPHKTTRYLPQAAQQWLSQLTWVKPPKLEAELALTAPAWTNRQPDWQADVRPTLWMRGLLDFEQGAAYQQLQVLSARAHFLYSNQCWQVPDLQLIRPEGRLEAELWASELSQDFHSRFASTIDPAILRPFLDEQTRRGFDLVSFTQAPQVEAEVWGRSSEPERVSAQGRLLLSNFTFRGEAITRVETQLLYSNRSLNFLRPRIDTGNRYVKADSLTVDLDKQLIYLTNGYSTADPLVVARAIGPHIEKAIHDYQFGVPPTARVYGIIPLHGEEGADLHFDLAGGPFHWWKFHIPHITGQVHWGGLHLTITNVAAEFYHGLAAGWAAFDFPKTPGTDFQFVLSTTNVLLQSLMADLSTSTNQPEGRLYADLAITKANSDDWKTVFGYGEAHLRDGLLWDIPLFGIFSPVLNGIAPGLGNNRASSANASFIITNGVIHTSDLEIRSTGMRLQYRGNVNLESQLNARVDAELLRDMWLVGPLVSTVFWPVAKLFEYKVSGTLGDPRSEPVFIIPKIMLMPLHPFRTLKGLKPEDPNSNPNFSPLPP